MWNQKWRDPFDAMRQDGPMKEILAAMQRSPFNERLARHVKQRILGGDPPVTRADILEHDPNCVVLFDWVSNLLTPLVERSNKTWEIVELPELKEKREKAAEAVGEQEKKVAQLRRKLREAIRSEQAAADFAAQNRPGNVSTEKGNDAGDELLRHQTATKSETVQLEITGQKSLQYRLEEVAIPSTQEAILQSLVKTLMEPRGIHRRLEIVGHCEARFGHRKLLAFFFLKASVWIRNTEELSFLDVGPLDDSVNSVNSKIKRTSWISRTVSQMM